MGTTTPIETAQDFVSRAELMASELVDNGATSISLDDAGDRKVAKSLVKSALHLADVTGSNYSLFFDGDENSFMVTLDGDDG